MAIMDFDSFLISKKKKKKMVAKNALVHVPFHFIFVTGNWFILEIPLC